MNVEQFTYTLPTAYLSYIEYGHVDDLTTDEITEINTFLEETKGAILSHGDEEFFSSYPDIGLPSQCVETTATYLND